MSAISEIIVREYFELHGFFVRQQRKYLASNRRDDDEIDFLVLNPRPTPEGDALPFVLTSRELRGIARAVVVVKGWHTETFGPSVLANAPEIFRFLEPAILQRATRVFGEDGLIARVLVVPALPRSKAARAESIEVLRAKGINAVLPFRTMLEDLIERVEVNRNYQKSDLLQMLRIIKAYDLFKSRQLELFKPRRRRTKQTGS
jgi:hypothetical protein